MALNPREQLHFTDGKGRSLGLVSIERIEGDRIFGRLVHEGDFDQVEALFREFEDAVNDQVFSVVDQLSQRIEDLGLRLTSVDDTEQLELCDVQIMNGHDLACRVPDLGLTQPSQTAAEVG